MIFHRIASQRDIAASLAAAVALASVLSACSSVPPCPPKAPMVAHKYVIGPLDAITVTVWRNPELSVTTQVRPDGRISMPLVDDLPALGKTPSELAHDIQTALERYVKEPIVSVGVNGFQGPYTEQIRVIGEAAKPQVIPYRQNMTLLDVMIQVGGLTDYADGNGAMLVRGAEEDKECRVRIKDLVKGGRIEANVEVMPGDVLIIPQSFF